MNHPIINNSDENRVKYIYGIDLHTLKPFIIVKVKFRGFEILGTVLFE